MTPKHARLALVGFLAISGAAAWNVLFLQDRAGGYNSVRLRQSYEKPQYDTLELQRAVFDAGDAKPQRSRAGALKRPDSPESAGTPAGTSAPQAKSLEQPPPAIPAVDSEQRLQRLVLDIQLELEGRGYSPGAPDGMIGLVTRAAIMAYEHDQGLRLTGEPSEWLLAYMRGGASRAGARPSTPSTQAEQVIRAVQQSLSQIGFFAAKVDGAMGPETQRAIRAYEIDRGLVPSGRISAPLMLKLARSTSIAGPRKR